MTVIAWDGKTLAADKLGAIGDLRQTVTKIWRINGALLGVCGTFEHGIALREWWKTGAKAENCPAPWQGKDESAALIVVLPERRVLKYDGPQPFVLEDKFLAFGSGREFATMAMRLGKTAEQAVLLTNELCSTTGMGVDSLELEC